MKHLCISIMLMGALTANIEAIVQTCTPTSEECTTLAVASENIPVSSCKRNAGIINVIIENRLQDPRDITITLTGPKGSIVKNFTVPDTSTTTIPFEGLINGSYTVEAFAETGFCTFTCNIVVNNRILNCLPFLYCCCQ